jgi:hypothetical protein
MIWELLLGALPEILLGLLGLAARPAVNALWIAHSVGDRYEERLDGIPTRRCRVVDVTFDVRGEILTVEWDDDHSRATGRPGIVLRGMYVIHPLAPRLDRSRAG